MNRRSKEVQGYVNFPVDDPEWETTNEGGMFVRLVVEDSAKSLKESWNVCSGGLQSIQFDETLISDDHHEILRIDTSNMDPDARIDALFKEQDSHQEMTEFHFPHFNDFERDLEDRFSSVPYLCVLTLGSTGWSGHNPEKGVYWTCAYEDLTEKGQTLYDLIESLYEGCDLYLQTWLDT